MDSPSVNTRSPLQLFWSWLRGLLVKPTVPPVSVALAVQPKAELVGRTPEVMARNGYTSVFWRSEITGTLHPQDSFILLYFCVCRTASAACRIQKAVLERLQSTNAQTNKAEILRLVAWDHEVPHVCLEVSQSNDRWVCKQRNEFGVREPFGYVVLTTAFAPGLLNSLRLTTAELSGPPVRYLLREDSTCVRELAS
jgi:hypothetical protein